jgi:hypothetical protein
MNRPGTERRFSGAYRNAPFMFSPTPVSSVLVGNPIEFRIRESVQLSDEQKKDFLNLLSYFTPSELTELEALI